MLDETAQLNSQATCNAFLYMYASFIDYLNVVPFLPYCKVFRVHLQRCSEVLTPLIYFAKYPAIRFDIHVMFQ